jgi:aspartyl-tRNA(Asn)/glutamyl-tRNA(Gln) amidotransferase subunit A
VSADLLLVPLAPDVAAAYERALRTIEAAGARLVEVGLPEASHAFSTFGTIQRAEALASHVGAGLWPARAGEYGADVRARMELAERETLAGYLAASSERQRLRAGFARALSGCDVLVSPVGAGSPAVLGEERVQHLGRALDFRELVMSFTTPQDLTGLPACAVRAGFDALGVPVGIQFTGRPFAEATVLRAAQGFWDATPDVQARWPEL